jgi:hypothetical protein
VFINDLSNFLHAPISVKIDSTCYINIEMSSDASRYITLINIKDQCGRQDLTISEKLWQYSLFLSSVAHSSKSTANIELKVPNIKSYITAKACIEYMKICANSPEGKEKPGPDIAPITASRIDAFLSKGEENLMNSLFRACDSDYSRYHKLLANFINDANYLALPHLVTKIAGVIALNIYKITLKDEVADTKALIDNATLPQDFEIKHIEDPSPNLITTDDLDTRINRVLQIPGIESIVPLDYQPATVDLNEITNNDVDDSLLDSLRSSMTFNEDETPP